jgi:hypothetical protein
MLTELLAAPNADAAWNHIANNCPDADCEYSRMVAEGEID